mmetsp:Transcript_56290/g.157911  ORF Transcript_56290/g.157911 Transcript_56290/m.157911 type:complete len:104 (-) Transcript_56290:43-354(-)
MEGANQSGAMGQAAEAATPVESSLHAEAMAARLAGGADGRNSAALGLSSDPSRPSGKEKGSEEEAEAPRGGDPSAEPQLPGAQCTRREIGGLASAGSVLGCPR